MNRILVAEDEEGVVAFLEKGLRASGYVPTTVGDGRAALALARTDHFDLLVLDLGLPDIDGYTVVNELRHDERLRSLPLVVYTGSELDETDRRRLRLGETRFVTKAGGSPAEFERQVIGLLRSITSATTA